MVAGGDLDAQTAPRAGVGRLPSTVPAQLANPRRQDGDVSAAEGRGHPIPLPGHENHHPLDSEADGHHCTSGLNPWRARCGEIRSAGSEGGPGKRIGRNADTAPRSDPYTKLRGPAKWTYYYLYVILDIFCRYVVGWMVASRESAALAEVLIRQTCAKQGIDRDQFDHPRRPRQFHDQQAGRVLARRSRCHPVTFAAARLQRQPVQRGSIQDVKVPARAFQDASS